MSDRTLDYIDNLTIECAVQINKGRLELAERLLVEAVELLTKYLKELKK